MEDLEALLVGYKMYYPHSPQKHSTYVRPRRVITPVRPTKETKSFPNSERFAGRPCEDLNSLRNTKDQIKLLSVA